MRIYRGVVEDNNSPAKDGSVRVRILGIHTPYNENSSEDFNYIKTDDLPWAEVLQSTDFGFNTGLGVSSVPLKGTWVYVLLDDEFTNNPIVIGAVAGIPTEITKYSDGVGFNDPDGKFPLEDRLDEPDINRLARAENLDQTIHQIINDSVDIAIKTDPISGADVSQTEPDSTNDASEYPKVHVTETQSGHVIEVDDTSGNERIRVYHTSGTYIEIKPDGTIVNKSVGTDNHYIYEGNLNEHIKSAVKTYIEGSLDEVISGSVKRAIEGTLDEHIVGMVTRTLDGILDEHIIGPVTKTLDATLTEKVTGLVTKTYLNEVKESVAIKHTMDTPQQSILGNLYVKGKIYAMGNIVSDGSITGAIDVKTPLNSLNSHGHAGINVPPTPGTGSPDSPLSP